MKRKLAAVLMFFAWIINRLRDLTQSDKCHRLDYALFKIEHRLAVEAYILNPE